MKKQLFNVLVVLVAVIIFYACSLPTTEHAKPEATSNDVLLLTTAQNPHVYKLVKLPLSWENAKKYCENMGGYLACINSQEEQKYIYDNFIVPVGSPACWIGGTNAENEGTWKWVNGDKWDYENWDNGEPDNGGGLGDEDCLATLPNGKWFDGDGDVGKFYFICEWNSEADIKESAKHVYKYIPKTMTWAAAKTYCERMGGYLACVTSQTEQEYIWHNYLAPNGTPLSWGGASDYKKEDKWEWVSGEEWNYTKWYPGEPDNSNDQDFMFFNSGNTWSDGGYGLLSFVCEWNKEADIKEPTEHIYKYFSEKMTWSEAKAYCEKIGGYLVSVTSQEEQNLIYTNVLVPNGSPECWIGLSDVENEGTWKWANGEGFYYSNWHANEPSDKVGNENYTLFYSNGTWNDGGNGRLPFICEWDKKEDIINPTGHVYEFIPKAMTWAAAKTYCERRGGYLASVTSQIEQEYIYENYIVPNGNPAYWIGGNNFENEGTWKWVNGDKWNYENWDNGEPDNGGGLGDEDFLAALPNGKWFDGDGDAGKFYFVCEWDKESDKVEATEHIYKYVDKKMTWNEAKKYCENLGGYLVSVTSQEEQRYVYNNYLVPNGTPNCWLGASDEEKEKTWKWASGEDFYYTNWSYREPNNYAGNEDYALFYYNGSWNDGGYAKLPFICEWNSEENIARTFYIEAVISDGTNLTCTDAVVNISNAEGNIIKTDSISGANNKIVVSVENSYTITVSKSGFDAQTFTFTADELTNYKSKPLVVKFFQTSHIYEFVDKKMTWNEAKTYCESRGGYLLSVTSPEEQKYIYSKYLVPNSTPECWLGASDEVKEGEWKWTSGEAWSYTNWSTNEPNGETRENYALFFANGTWNDGSKGVLPFICEWNSADEVKETNTDTCFTNSIGMEFVLVENGTFMMGSNSGYWEKPVHQVTISQDYYIGKYEVTQAQWVAVMGYNPSRWKGDNLPVEYVSWDSVQVFIAKLNELEGTDKYRLPTEAQWEFAARGGNKSQGYTYAGSNNIDEVAWYDGNSSYTTHQVGTKKANELGIYDMAGNVWECCSDWYGSYSSSSQTDPTGASSGIYRVLRGGSWYNLANYCRVAGRVLNNPGYSGSSPGFRLSCSQ